MEERVPASTAPFDSAILLALGLAVRAWLILAYPMIFGSDSVSRLVNRHLIIMAHQLPALQASIYGWSKISADPLLVRCWMALLGAIAGVGFYRLAADLVGRADALWAGLFFVTNPLILAYSIVPYQEILMLAALSFGFHFFFRERWVAASLALGLACLTRYESWAACPVLAVAYAHRRNWRPLEVVKASLLFGWAPAAWILSNAGLSPGGTFVVESSITWARLMRYVYIGWITVKNTPLPVLLLAGFGLWQLWKQRLLRDWRFAALGTFLALFLLAIPFSAHGDPRDQQRFVSAREAHLPVAGMLLLAALGLSHLSRWRTPLALAGVALGLWAANRLVVWSVSQPEVALSYRTAQYLDRTLGPGEKALVLAKPVPPEGLEAYLERAYRAGGEAGRRGAERVLQSIDRSPPGYQRTLVQSRLGRDRLLAAPVDGVAPQWVVLWSDFRPATAEQTRICGLAAAAGAPVETFSAGPLSVRIYRLALGSRNGFQPAPGEGFGARREIHGKRFQFGGGAEKVRVNTARRGAKIEGTLLGLEAQRGAEPGDAHVQAPAAAEQDGLVQQLGGEWRGAQLLGVRGGGPRGGALGLASRFAALPLGRIPLGLRLRNFQIVFEIVEKAHVLLLL